MNAIPSRAIIHTRISDARAEIADTKGDQAKREITTVGVEDQVKRCRERANVLGWTVGPDATHVIIENDTSAYKRRKIRLPDGRWELRTVRPGFRQVLNMLADGRADALIALDLDRAARDPRDLEDLIDVVESRSPRIPVESVTGSLRLSNDGEVMMARTLVAVANKSSRDTARRVADARERNAAEGKFGGGSRRFGFEKDGITVREAEAAEIRRAAESILAGVSLREVTADLRRRGVPTVAGGAWRTKTVRDILMSARIAGIKIYKGREVGASQWPAIVDESTWRGVVAILSDPARRTSPVRTSPAPKWLLSLIATCWKCGETVTVSGGRAYSPSYTCRGKTAHMRRAAIPLENFVSDVIIARLSQPDAAKLVIPRPGVDIAALQREAKAARERLNGLAAMYAKDEIEVSEWQSARKVAKARLDDAEAALAAAAPSDALAGIAGQPDAGEIWDSLSVSRRRAIVRVLCEVKLVPCGRGGRLPNGRYFNPDGVEITWKSPQGSGASNSAISASCDSVSGGAAATAASTAAA